MVFSVLVPIVVQNAITNFVSLLDNLMVGAIGTEQMSGVAIGNQLLFVFYICIFGGLSGAGIFTAQFYGSKNHEGVRETFRMKVWIALIVMAIATVVFAFFSEPLVSLYLTDGEGAGDLERTLEYGVQYIRVMMFGFLPFVVTNIYSSTVRECGKTMLPMKAGIVAVITNLVLNYLLIFGSFGFPKLGVVGAAVATVISRYVETAIIVITVHSDKFTYDFMRGCYKTLRIRGSLVKNIIIKGMPLLWNELLWSVGTATALQCYSIRGLATIAGLNISSTVTNMFNVICMAMGNAVAIIVGQALGSGDGEHAKDLARKIIAFNVFIALIFGTLMFVSAPFIPLLYNTTDVVRDLASSFLRIAALTMPIFAFLHTCYFTLRSGGKTIITFIFDSGFMWALTIPLAFCLANFTSMAIVPLYLVVQLADLIKCSFGAYLLKKGSWVQNIAADNA
ncbi:MAG: MATE family efflux transporter [Clostridia bacterium]|nr:MATE family efflux transporter [Clostridia bacterium]